MHNAALTIILIVEQGYVNGMELEASVRNVWPVSLMTLPASVVQRTPEVQAIIRCVPLARR